MRKRPVCNNLAEVDLLGFLRREKVCVTDSIGDIFDTAVQATALKTAPVLAVCKEKASGGRWDRPELHRLLNQLRKADVLVVWNSTGCPGRSVTR